MHQPSNLSIAILSRELSCIYHKVLIISPALMFVQTAFLVVLFSRVLNIGGAYYWREFCVSKWVASDNKNSLKHEDNSLKH